MSKGRSVASSGELYFPCDIRCATVSFHNFKSQNFKLSVSNPKNKYVAYVSVLSHISNCQGLGRKNKHDILKTDRIISIISSIISSSIMMITTTTITITITVSFAQRGAACSDRGRTASPQESNGDLLLKMFIYTCNYACIYIYIYIYIYTYMSREPMALSNRIVSRPVDFVTGIVQWIVSGMFQWIVCVVMSAV